MSEKTLATMTETQLRALVEEVVEERLRQQAIEVSFARLPPESRTPENRRYIEALLTPGLPFYSEANDPILEGFFDGPPDLAKRTKEILRAEMGTHPGKPDKEA